MLNFLYEHMHIHSISINIYKRLSRFDLKIHEIDHQKYLPVNELVSPLKI
jgi:hypothetical protein